MREQMHVRIVPMTGDHLDEVAELERVCFSTPGPGICWRRNWTTTCPHSLWRWMTGPRGGLRRFAGGAGRGLYHQCGRRPECRRKGFARKLLQVFFDFAQGNHLAFLTLEVRASNYPAIALYGSRGFRSVDGVKITTSIPGRMPSS